MRPESLKLFAKLMENGYITREQSPAYYEYYNDPEIASELAIMEQELDFTLYKTNGRLYLLPDPNNELFSQDNNDFRRSVGNEKLEELYLLNYMAIFLLHELYGGKGNTLQTRYYIKESDFLSEFTKHCEQVRSEGESLKMLQHSTAQIFCTLLTTGSQSVVMNPTLQIPNMAVS